MFASRRSVLCSLCAQVVMIQTSVANAQDVAKKPEQAIKTEQVQAVSRDSIIKITIHPKAIKDEDIEKPLMPRFADMSHGNAMLEYFRGLAYDYLVIKPWDRELEEKKSKWSEMPLDELPVEELEKTTARASLEIMRDGARKTYADMEYLDRIKKGGLYTLLGEVQAMRENNRNLRLRTRLLIREKKYNQALDMIRTGLAIPRHLSAQYGNINYLSAASITNTTISSIQDWVARPDSSNLYWGLSQLPRPFLHIDKLMESELFLFDVMEKKLTRNLDQPMNEEDALLYFAQQVLMISPQFSGNGLTYGTKNDKKWNDAIVAFVAKLYPVAFESLKKSGYDETKLKAMPKTQVCAFFQRRVAESQFRRYARWIQFDPWVAIRQIGLEKEVKITRDGIEIAALPQFVINNQEIDAFSLVPLDQFALSIVLSRARIETRLNILSIIEMLRDFATDHPELPASMSQLDRYPMSLTDHYTGQQIRYNRIDARTARFEAGPPVGMPGVDLQNQLRFEIHLAK